MRMSLVIAALLAAAMSSALAHNPSIEPAAYYPVPPPVNGLRMLDRSELYAQISGRTISGTVPGTMHTYEQTFHPNGVVESESGNYRMQGTWLVGFNHKVFITWDNGSKPVWGIRTNNAGRYFNSESGSEIFFKR